MGTGENFNADNTAEQKCTKSEIKSLKIKSIANLLIIGKQAIVTTKLLFNYVHYSKIKTSRVKPDAEDNRQQYVRVRAACTHFRISN